MYVCMYVYVCVYAPKPNQPNPQILKSYFTGLAFS